MKNYFLYEIRLVIKPAKLQGLQDQKKQQSFIFLQTAKISDHPTKYSCLEKYISEQVTI